MNSNNKDSYTEIAVAGCILLDAGCLDEMDFLQETDFTVSYCKTIFRCAKHLQEMDQPIDPVTIQAQAELEGEPLPNSLLREIMEVTTNPQNALHYAHILQKNSLSRDLQSVGNGLQNSQHCDPQDVIEGTKLQLEYLEDAIQDNHFICIADVAAREQDFLIAPYIPMGKGTMIQAEPGVGKTALACKIAACVSTGQSFAGLKVAHPGNVLLLSTEDDAGVLRCRLEADGADVNKIFIQTPGKGFTLKSPEIARMIKKLHASVVIFDPLQAFFGANVDMNRANETHSLLTKLYAMCDKNHCACILVAHLSKSTKDKSPVTQSLGSVDIAGAQRSILHIVRNPDNEKELYAFHVKSSDAASGKTIVFSIGDKGSADISELIDLDISSLNRRSRKSDTPIEQDPLVEVIGHLMAENPKGKFYSYEEISNACIRFVGFRPYRTTMELRRHMEHSVFRAELQKRLHTVFSFKKTRYARGVVLEPYVQPEGYQQRLPDISA